MSFISFYLLGSFFSFVTSCFIYRYMKEDKYITYGHLFGIFMFSVLSWIGAFIALMFFLIEWIVENEDKPVKLFHPDYYK